jgi:AP endonuclease-2
MPPLSILSFNIGQRGLALTLGDRTLGEFLVSLGAPDIVCFQETKTLRTDLTDRTAIAQGYSCFFACHRSVSNWCGVLTCVRDGVPVLEVQAGLFGALSHSIVDLRGSRAASEGGGALALDSEGRVMLTDHGVLVLANVYLPALGGTTDRDARVAVKAAFCEGLAAAVVELQGKGRRVVVCGDLNISHRPVDNSEAATYSRRHGGQPFEGDQFRVWLSGMLVPRERLLLLLEGDARAARSALADALLLRGVRPLLVDSFRALHPTATGAYTCWDAAAACRGVQHCGGGPGRRAG